MAEESPRLDLALVASQAAIEEARSFRQAVAVVVVNADGRLVTAQKMDSAYLSAETIARRKAFTAANFRRPTHEMAERLGSIEYQLSLVAADERLTFLKGGLPLSVNGEMVLAIGVSGASADQDLACCHSAAGAVAAHSGAT